MNLNQSMRMDRGLNMNNMLNLNLSSNNILRLNKKQNTEPPGMKLKFGPEDSSDAQLKQIEASETNPKLS